MTIRNFLVKIYQIPVSSVGAIDRNIPDITDMINGNYGSIGTEEYSAMGDSGDYPISTPEYEFNDKQYGEFDDLKDIEQGDDSTTTSPFPARIVAPNGYPNPEDNTLVDAFLINERLDFTFILTLRLSNVFVQNFDFRAKF